MTQHALNKSRTVIFTDLDGSLLDHYSYSFQPAKGALNWLAAKNIPVILASSKTYAEMITLKKQLLNHHPFIVENGAALYLPNQYFDATVYSEIGDKLTRTTTGDNCIALSKPRHYWQQMLNTMASDYPQCWTTFDELGTEGIMEVTGLTKSAAAMANERAFSEPLIWQASETKKKQFLAELRQKGANLLRGGRFLHVTDLVDKGNALGILCSLYAKQYQASITSVALGDGENDIPMLYSATQGVLIRSPVNPLPNIDAEKNIYTTEKFGPEGWAEAINTLLMRSET